MLRTNTIQLLPTKRQVQLLKEILLRSSAMWNLGNYQKRQALFQKIPIPSGFYLQKALKTHSLYKTLGSAYSQQILKKLQEAWNAFFGALQSRNSTHQVGLPS
ncbi:MAG: hypothetical protein ACFFD2_16855 [Promethearchaeota archaeon]